jgi:hypothetical protein
MPEIAFDNRENRDVLEATESGDDTFVLVWVPFVRESLEPTPS